MRRWETEYDVAWAPSEHRGQFWIGLAIGALIGWWLT